MGAGCSGLAPFFKTLIMPISSHALLPYVVQELEKVKPHKVLDIGIGNGIYGALVWNYSEAFMNRIPRICGIEAWEAYDNHMWRLYDEIHLKPLQEFTTHHKFELIIMADVIEHLELKEGHQQIKRYKSMLSPGGVMIVSTPAVFVPQLPYKGNAYEVHKSLWTGEKFKALGFQEVRNERDTLFGELMLIYKFKQEDK